MKSITKHLKIVIVSIILLMVANFSFAQSVTNQDLIQLKEKEEALAELRISNRDSQQYKDAETDFMRFCSELGDRVLAVTKNKYSTLYTGLTCVFGLYGKPGTSASDILSSRGFRNYTVVSDPSGAASSLQAHIRSGTVPLDQERVAVIEKVVADANKNSENEAAWYSQLVGGIITAVFNVLTTILLGIASIAAWALDWATNSTVAAKQPEIVAYGWGIIRDIMNMFFVLALIVISLATILKIESYNYRKLLANLILMALLINFSKVIAEALIAVSDMVMLMFSSQAGLKDYGSQLSGIITEGRGSYGFIGGGDPFTSAVGKSVLKLISAMFMTISFLAIAALLVIRLIGLWVLIVLSPIAYALNVLPRTKQYASQWWNTFIKYLIWAPVAMFFIFLGRQLVVAKGNGSITGHSVFDYILISAFIWAAVLVAKSAGMYGAQGIISAAEKGFSATRFAGTALGKYTLRGSWLRDAGKLSGSKRLTRVGEGLTKTTAFIEAAPRTVSTAFKNMEGARQSDVNKASRTILRRTPWMSAGEDAYKSADDKDLYKLANNDMSRQEIENMMRSGKKQSLNGVLKAILDKKLDKPELLEEVRDGLWKRMGGSGLAPENLVKDATTTGGEGLELQPDGTVKVKFTDQQGNARERLYFLANNPAVETEFWDDEEVKNYSSEKQKAEESRRTYNAAKDNPAIERLIAQEVIAGKIYSAGELANVETKIAAVENGSGLRKDVPQSIITPSGQRIIISKNVAEKMSLKSDAYLDKSEIPQLVKILRDEGISDVDIAKVNYVATQTGGISVQLGRFAALDTKLGSVSARREVKQHERSHALYNYIEKFNKVDYEKIKQAVMGDSKFQQLKDRVTSDPLHKNIADWQVVEEILANSQLRNQVAEQTRNSVEAIMGGHRELFIQKSKEVARAARKEKTPELKANVLARLAATSNNNPPKGPTGQ